MQTFRKGDIVSVQAVVEYDFNAGAPDKDKVLFLKVPGRYEAIGLTPDHWSGAHLTMVQPSFDVGEDVQWREGTGTILAIADGHAWIDLGGGAYCTRMLSTIERMEPSDVV